MEVRIHRNGPIGGIFMVNIGGIWSVFSQFRPELMNSGRFFWITLEEFGHLRSIIRELGLKLDVFPSFSAKF